MRRTSKLRVPTLLLSLGPQILGALLLWLSQLPVAGQSHAGTSVTPTSGAGSLGTTVTQNGNVYGITGGKTAGSNVFHSFGQFSVATGDTAQFQTSNLTPNAAISNILGRVTGGNASAIFGAVDSATYYPSANLFLMNPAGFLFGPNASVNVGGMVSFTTADYLKLRDGNLFKAVPDVAADAVLSTSPVAAFGFLGSNPAAISIQGSTLQVAEGKSLSLVGGNQGFTATDPDTGGPISVPGGITITGGTLSASGGQINLASVASPGELLAGSLGQAPNINGASFGTLGAIQISEQSVIDVSGHGGGTVLIRGGQFLLDNSTISANVTAPGPIVNEIESVGSGIDIQVTQNAVVRNAAVLETNISGNATPGVQYGGVYLKADNIEIRGSQDLENFPFTGIRSNIVEGSTGGNSGNITLEGNTILVQDLGTFSTILESTTGGVGDSGNIVLNGNTNVHIDGATIQTITKSASGNAGDITVKSVNGEISLTNFPFLQSFSDSGSGNTGDIAFIAKADISMQGPFIFTESDFGTGNAGKVSISSLEGSIRLTDGPFISTQTVSSSGNAGSLTVSAPNGDFLLAGANDFFQPGVLFSAIRPPEIEGVPVPELQPSAGTGKIDVTAKNLTLFYSGIQIDNFSLLQPGNITVNLSGTLSLAGTRLNTFDGTTTVTSTIGTTSRGPARASDLHIAAHSIHVTDGGKISTETFRAGSGGTLNLVTNDLQLTNGGQIRSGSTVLFNTGPGNPPSSPTGAGGTIIVQGRSSPTDSVLIDGAGSGIFTNTELSGAGGSVLLNANSLTIQNGGTISAATTGTAASATGGTITINAGHVAVNTGGVITAETNGIAPAGSIDINTGTLAIDTGGQIRSSSGAETLQLRSFATSQASAPLTGGTITIDGRTGNGSQADSVTIDGAGSGIFTQSSGSRPGGDINLMTSGSVTMTNGASISASSTGAGNAGNVQINSGNQFAMTNSSVTTEASQSGGGTIKITTNSDGNVQLSSSTISASVLDGAGGGGSVNIDPDYVLMTNSSILANAVFGPGGNILITTNLLLPDSSSIISASSAFGQQGTVTVQSPVAPASGKIIPLGQKPLIATSMLSQRCAALAGGTASSFTVAGRDSLPAEPGGWVSAPLALSMADYEDGITKEAGLSATSEEDIPLLSLRKIAPSGFLTQGFAVDSSEGCQS